MVGTEKEPIRQFDQLPDVMDLWPTCGQFLGLTEWQSYEYARRGIIPVLMIGRHKKVVKTALKAMLDAASQAAI